MSDSDHTLPAVESLSQVEIACPNCAARFWIAESLLGRRLSCRFCREVWRAQPRRSNVPVAPPKPQSSSQRAVEGLPIAGESDSSVIDTNWAGRRIGRYSISAMLGRGGMGIVWRAHDDSLKRDVALKILTGKNGQANRTSVDLFLQEARAAAKLQHPHVVSVHEVGEDRGQNFIALELMHGGTLKDVVDLEGPIAPRELFRQMIGPAKALALAHRRGVLHRDVKPGNLMYDDHGHLKLTDFGLAHVNDDPASLHLAGRAVGSLGWIAPEVARGDTGSPQTDIYSFGLCLIFGLTGKQMFTADSRSQLLKMHQQPPMIDFAALPELDPKAVELLQKCLATDPRHRFASTDELIAALTECATEPPPPPRPLPAMPPVKNQSRLGYLLLGAIVGGLIAAIVAVHYIQVYLDRIYQRGPVRPVEVAHQPAADSGASIAPTGAAAPPQDHSAASRPSSR